MRRLVIVFTVFLSLLASRADAVTIRDVIELSKAGLSDQVLIALIEVDRSVYTLDAATLKQLKDSGVSDAVIIALVRSGRTQEAAAPSEPPAEPPSAPAPDPQPQVIVIDHHEPVVQQVPVVVPVAVPVFVMVTACAALVVLSAWLANVSEVGLAESVAVLVPPPLG